MTTTMTATATSERARVQISRAVLDRLSEDERAMANRLMMERLEFMRAEVFDAPGAEATLLDPPVLGGIKPIQRFVQAVADPIGPADLEMPAGVVLTSEQERAMFLKYNYCRYRLASLAAAEAAGSADGVRSMLPWLSRVLELRDELVNANMPLVLAMAKRTRLSNVDFAELISEGNMALLRAIDKFDVGRGFKFSTYGCRAILKAFSRASATQSRYHERFPAEFDPDMERSDSLESRRQETETNCADELREILRRNTAGLTDVEMTVIRERFPLAPDARPGTLAQVGQLVGVTKERVRQIQNKALQKIRQALEDEVLVA